MSVTELGDRNYSTKKHTINYEPLFKRIDMMGDAYRKMNMLEIVKDIWAFCSVYNAIDREDYNSRIDFLTGKNIELFTTNEELNKDLIRWKTVAQEYENRLINANLLQESERYLGQTSLSKKLSLSEESATSSESLTEDSLPSNASDLSEKQESEQEELPFNESI
jgi:hypothetical protein